MRASTQATLMAPSAKTSPWRSACCKNVSDAWPASVTWTEGGVKREPRSTMRAMGATGAGTATDGTATGDMGSATEAAGGTVTMGFATEGSGVGDPVVGGASAGVVSEGALGAGACWEGAFGAGEFFFFDAPDLRTEI